MECLDIDCDMDVVLIDLIAFFYAGGFGKGLGLKDAQRLAGTKQQNGHKENSHHYSHSMVLGGFWVMS